jgi:glyoxylase-like metal-dependent hydrolase (beta-lactamase superfamily II)
MGPDKRSYWLSRYLSGDTLMKTATVNFDGVRLRIGDSSVYRIADIERIKWPRQSMFKDLDDKTFRKAVQNVPQATDQAGTDLLINFNCYVIDAPNFLCLIDAGVGNDKERPDRPAWHRRSGGFLQDLARLGFSPDDFDIVINTHLHADHVGWNTKSSEHGWVPTFPNARYIVPEIELNYWRGRSSAEPEGNILHGAFDDSVRPILDAKRYEVVELPREIESGLWFEPAPGHTPGMGIVRWVAGAAELMFLADVLHSPIQLEMPDLTSNFCNNPALARDTRRRLLERCADTGALTATYHFPPPVFARVERKGGSFALHPIELSVGS